MAIPEIDFETYSEAGYTWDGEKYLAPKGATKPGLAAVGAVVYAEHPTAEVLSLAYDMKDGLGPRLWIPGMPPPQELFDHVARGGLLEAWNSKFEYWIWLNVCHARMDWPHLPFWQLRDAMAKARAHSWPGRLKIAAKVAGAAFQKIDDGMRLLKKFSIPRKPTIKDPRRRIRPEDDPQDAAKLYEYNIYDIKAEAAVSELCPELSPEETEYWLCTEAMNIRGVAIDAETVSAGCDILDQAMTRYNQELFILTEGEVETAAQGARLCKWLSKFNVHTKSVDAEHVAKFLKDPILAPPARRALEIRQLVGSAGVKKLYTIDRMKSRSNRLHDLIAYHAARTGRDAGQDAQPQNLVKQGPPLLICESCGKSRGRAVEICPYCGAGSHIAHTESWSWEYVDEAVNIIRMGDLSTLESVYGDALLAISGCIRGMFVASEGHDLVCSDYSSIEAVVTAVIAGEQWRIDAFRNKEDIYLHSASKTTGVSYEEYVRYKHENSHHHPDRQKIGKPRELALGFGGWVGAYRRFDDSDTFTDDEVRQGILAWREASPKIPELWGGQVRGKPWAPDRKELYGLEGAAISALLNIGQCFSSHGITYGVKNDVLYCKLHSGRCLTYHQPRLEPSNKWEGQLQISFWGWNTNPQKGAIGWIKMYTYGGDLAQSVIQATARDFMFHSIPHLERAGYPIVMRVHDELVAEVPEGFGSIEEFESIMSTPPKWAEGWPVRAAGGWRGKRYRKD